MAAGRMPFLRRLRDNGQYPLHTFYSGLPSTTPAVQGELYYGVRAGVPAFSFLDRSLGEMGMLFDPDWARRFEEKFAAQGEGLLRGGSSWSNIFSGGAAPEESNFALRTRGSETHGALAGFTKSSSFSCWSFPRCCALPAWCCLSW